MEENILDVILSIEEQIQIKDHLKHLINDNVRIYVSRENTYVYGIINKETYYFTSLRSILHFTQMATAQKFATV